MPRHGNVGYSKNTPVKQDHFRLLLDTHMRIVNGLFQAKPWIEPLYFYLDLNAGPGRYPVHDDWLYGSPLIACAVAQAIGLPLQAIFCEQGAREVQSLREELIRFGFAKTVEEDVFHNARTIMATICADDYLVTSKELLRHFQEHIHIKRYGLIYSDENGNFPPFDLLGQYALVLPYVDIVIHLAASPIKLQRVSPIHQLSRRLDEFLGDIQKRYWMIREPYLQHQWSFLIGTNWSRFPQFKRQKFWPINSPEGANILRKLSFTTKERRNHDQGNLFEGWES
jgi:hypothetical protein